MVDKKQLTINDFLDLAEKHNTMGQFVQQKLHDFRNGKRKDFDEVSKVRILGLLQEAKGLSIEGASTLFAAVEGAPIKEDQEEQEPDKTDSKDAE